MTRIITDSCSDLSQDLINRFHIDVIPLGVFIDGKTYQDGIDIHTANLFAEVERTGNLPQTAAPSVATFIEHFSRPEDVIYIGISTMLSATQQNALLARDTLDKNNLYLVDSLNLSTGIALLVLAAAEMAASGMKSDKIVEKIEQMKSNVHSSFVIDTLEYIHKGGRCTATEMLVGSLLKIRPVIEVKPDGTLGIKKKISGSRKKALNSMLEDFKTNLTEVDQHRIFITHTLCDEDAEYLKDQLKDLLPFDEICITVAGSTIASHCGPNTIGILYLTK